ncbi:MAG TPA: flagellar biosynthetic protein FliO [Acidocella sp.]|nr:flagellar biosynthetic protein FliO [Acidocella sp.]
MPPQSLWASSLTSLLVILALLGLAWWLARFLRRAPWANKPGAQPRINLTHVRSLGARNMLAVAEIEGQRFLIGIGRNGITRIGRLENPQAHDAR